MSNNQAVLDFFVRHGVRPLPIGDAALSVAYLDVGLIDSLGIVTLISELESKLGVQFSAEAMLNVTAMGLSVNAVAFGGFFKDIKRRPTTDYEFVTVGGLIAILDRLTGTSG